MAPIWCRGYCQLVSQSKEYQENATIKSTSRKCYKIKCSNRECRNHRYFQAVPQKVHPRSATIKSTSRECRNQKYCQGVSQFKYSRKCHNQMYYQGRPQSRALPGTATIKDNARECRNNTYPASATNRSTTREYDH